MGVTTYHTPDRRHSTEDGDSPVDKRGATVATTAQKKPFALKVRIPGWVKGDVVPSDLYSYADGKNLGYSILVNGQETDGTLTEDGYFTIERKWVKGDCISVHFDMEPRVVKANSKVEADAGRIAVERGPVVYCAEWPDNDFSVRSMIVNQKPEFKVFHSEDLHGIDKISTDAQALSFDGSGRLAAKDVTLTLIPYYAWCHRGSGEMTVWMPQQLNAVNLDTKIPGRRTRD